MTYLIVGANLVFLFLAYRYVLKRWPKDDF